MENKNTMEGDGYCQCLVSSIIQNIFVYVQQMIVSHTVLGQVEGEYIITEFTFLGELSL